MDLKSFFCLILPTLATLQLSLAEDPSLVEGVKPLSGAGQRPLQNSDSAADKRQWSNFHSWGKRWGNFGTSGKKWASSDFPAWGKRWSGSSFTSWGKRNASPEEQKRNWNQFITWGKRNWHALTSWGKRSQEKSEKKWNTLPTWGKRAGWDNGFASWGKRDEVDVRDQLMKLFDESGDGFLDTKELGNFLAWMSSLNDMAAHP
uniref:Myoinhibitory peptide n=1 Tax=Haliotis discus hannai TaxID=42344 RepID=A0AAU6WVS5_HALDH